MTFVTHINYPTREIILSILQCVIITYINCPTRWCPSGLTPTHHQFGGVSGTGGEHTKVVPAHIVLGRGEERGVVIGSAL